MAGIDLFGRDATAIAHLIRSEQISAHEALDWAMESVALNDKEIHAVWSTFAERAHAQIDAGLPEGPFTGVPFLVKDLGLRIDGVVTTSGSRFFVDAVATFSSELVKRYERAGLVIFGKTSTSEFGLGPSADTDLYPRTNNPWNLRHVPGGSSSGSAAAVAAGVLPMVHASDGGGSIRIPAACCGVFGMKPSRGRITYAPVSESWNGMSTQHVVSFSVRDNAALLDATHGGLPGDPYYCPPPSGSYVAASVADPEPLHIAVHLRSVDGVEPEPEIATAIVRLAGFLEALGHRVEFVDPDFTLDEVGALFGILTSSTVTAMIEDRAKDLGRDPRPDELLAVTRAIARNGTNHRSVDLARAREACFTASRRIAAFTERFDAVLCPTIAHLPPEHGTYDMRNEDLSAYLGAIFRFAPYTAPASIAGQPAMNVPCGMSSTGLPIGAHVSAPFAREDVLYALAGQLERAHPWPHTAPQATA
jgi:Asp-tRNA(Asn)/Glu-tRNA(Gln) amidotransferase A subunit family amidase